MAAKKSDPKPEPAEALKEPAQAPELSVKIERLFSDPAKSLRALASVALGGGYVVRGIRLFENEKGLWISMPQRVYTDQTGATQYEDLFFPVTREARDRLHGLIREAYDQALEIARAEQTRAQPTEEPILQKM